MLAGLLIIFAIISTIYTVGSIAYAIYCPHKRIASDDVERIIVLGLMGCSMLGLTLMLAAFIGRGFDLL